MAKLLFLDDDVLTLQLMEKIASRLGHEAITCDSADDALHLAVTRHPDIILIDLSLKDMSGLSFVRNLRRIPEFETLPMIIASAGSTLQDEMDALDSGATGYVLKPVGPDTMIRIINQYYQAEH
jgi:DNA-binding response OmpR family regulator